MSGIVPLGVRGVRVLLRLSRRTRWPACPWFSPEANDPDIAERHDWLVGRVVDELERGMTEAGPVIAEAGGALDGVALGEWVHAGDVRDAWGEPGAYGGEQVELSLRLLARISRERGRLALHADLDDVDEPLLPRWLVFFEPVPR